MSMLPRSHSGSAEWSSCTRAKPAARPDYVVDKTFDLFCELGASDEQTDFPSVYTSAIK